MRRISVVLAIVAAAAPARADDREEARRAFAAGLAADRQRDWHGAIEHYRHANELVPHPNAMFNIATDYERIGQLREAAAWYRRYLDAAPPESSDRAKVAKTLAQLRDRPGTLTVRTRPSGLRVLVDGRFAGTSPLSGNIGGGPHRVTVEIDGTPITRDVDIEFGEPAMLEISGGNPEDPPPSTWGGTPSANASAIAPLGTITTGAKPRLGYLVGLGGGADLRGEGAVGLLDLGLSILQFDFAARVGKSTGFTTIDIVGRYAITKNPITPYVGAGYSVITNNDDMTSSATSGYGYTLIGGLKWDVARGDKLVTSVIVETGLRSNGGLDPGLVIPLMASVQVSGLYRSAR